MKVFIKRVKSFPRQGTAKNGKILKPVLQKNGYLTVSLNKNGKSKTVHIHRLVAETFLTNPDKLPEVNHKDGNKLNNCVENLEWCTSKENVQHSLEIGLRKFGKKFNFYNMKVNRQINH